MSVLGTYERYYFESMDEVEELNLKYSVITPLPLEFLREIDDSNQTKPDAPLALIVRAGKDENQALSSIAARHFILQIAKTYRIAIRELHAASLLGRAIHETSQGEKIRLLCVFAHGTRDYMEFGRDAYEIGDIERKDFEPLDEDAALMFLSCYTGLELAPKVAEVSKRIVQAPIDEFTCLATIFCASNPPKFLSYDKNGDSLVRQYHPDGSSEGVKMDQEMKKELFIEKFDYIFQLASGGDREAQYALGKMFQKGINAELSLEVAANWIRKAAEQGLPKAQTLMGDFYCNGWGGLEPSPKDALKWYRLAAEQGDLYGQTRCQQMQLVQAPKPVRDILFNMFELAN